MSGYVSPNDDVPAAPVEAVVIQWRRFEKAKTPLDAADALVALSNAMTDMASWTVFRNPFDTEKCDSCAAEGFRLTYSPDHAARFCDGCFERENRATLSTDTTQGDQ